MKEKKSKRVIVRITESQFNNLMECVIDEQIKISDILRESIIDKLQIIELTFGYSNYYSFRFFLFHNCVSI